MADVQDVLAGLQDLAEQEGCTLQEVAAALSGILELAEENGYTTLEQIQAAVDGELETVLYRPLEEWIATRLPERTM